jgi:hypothetical protein
MPSLKWLAPLLLAALPALAQQPPVRAVDLPEPTWNTVVAGLLKLPGEIGNPVIYQIQQQILHEQQAETAKALPTSSPDTATEREAAVRAANAAAHATKK